MTHSLFSAISVSVLASAVLSAGPGEISGSANRGTVITADIKTDTTWTRAQSPVAVSGAIHIAEGATLTIEHGVAVKFASGNGSGLTVNGRLVVAGTAAEPVYFSSSRDTGESISRFPVNLPGAGASSGDWAGIRFTGSRGDSSLEYAVVRYAAVAVRIDGRGGATVSHSILRDSAIGLSVDNDSASVRASDNRFVANGTALSGTAPSRCASLASGCGVIAEPSGFAAASGLRPRVAPQGNKMPSFATVPTGWTASTYAAASFAQPTSPVFGLPNEVQVQISSAQGEINRPPQYQGQAYGYQGSRHSVAGTGVGDTIEAELYVPASLGNSSAGNAASYLWANGSNGSAETDYAIAGFTNSTGHGGFAVWDENLGAFADLPVGTVPVIYNGWNTIEIVFSGSTYDYYINGVEAYSSSNSYGSTAMSSATVDAVNFFDPTTSFTGLNYTVTWADTPTAPVITSSTSLPSTLVGANYSQGLSVQAQPGVTYTWSAPSGLPPGIGLTSAGILQGSATTPGTFTFTVSVTNGVQTTQQNETIIVYGPLSITTSSLPFGIAGQSYGPVQFAASGGSGIQNQRWTAPGLTGFTLSTAGVFAGTTPANSQSVTVTVTDSVTGQTASSTYNVVVYPVLSITSTLPVGVAGAPYGPVQLTATGGSGNGNQTWTPATPSAGLTLSTTGVLSGTTPQSNASFSVTATDKLTSQTATVTYTLTVSAPPLVVSGPSTIPEVAVGGGISGSFSASGGTSPYTFRSTNLPPGATLGLTSGTVSGTATNAGIFPFTVTIADSGGKSSTLSSSLSVLGINSTSLPSATATTNFSYTFSASGGTGSYTWTASGLPGGLTLVNTGTLSGAPSSSGSFTFTVTVGDGVTTASTQVSLTVVSKVVPVTLPGGMLPPGQVNVPYTGNINAGGGTAPYTYSFSSGVLPNGVSIQSSGQVSGTPTVAGSFSFTAQAKDSLQATGSGSYTIVIAPAPIVVSGPSVIPEVAVGGGVSGAFSASGGTAPYTYTSANLPPGVTLGANSGTVGGTATTAGVFPFTVTIADSGGKSGTLSSSLSVLGINTASLPSATTTTNFSFTFSASGGTGTYTWTASGLPGGLTLGNTGILSGTPSSSGSFTFTITVRDGVTMASIQVSLTVASTAIPVSLPGGALSPGQVNVPYTGSISAGGGTAPYTYSFSSGVLPTGVSIQSSGQVSGTPTVAGSFSFTAQAKDSLQATASGSYTIVIAPAPIVISGPSAIPEVAVGGGVSGAFSASGGTAPYTYTSTNLPPGVTLGVNSGAVGGTATTAGVFPFAITATDSGGKTNTISSSLSVLGINAASFPSATATTNFSFTFSASGGTGTYTWTASGLPGGLILGSTGTLSGAPSNSGSFTFTVTVGDGVTTASTQLSLTVASKAVPVTLPGGTLSPGQVNVPYTGNINAGGGTAPYTYSFSGGVLPTGVSIQSSGQISGTPTVAGSFSFTAQAKDSLQAAGSGSYTIVIAPAPLVISSGTTLPNGIVGSDYGLQQLVGSGGVSPYTFTLSAGSLPPGLVFSNGQISGIPSGSGTFPFTVSVTDSAVSPSTATLSLSILINPAQANLLLSDSSVTFSLMSGATALPPGNNVTVRSSVILQNLNYTYALNPSVPWVSVAGGTSTPNTLQVTLTNSALSQLPAGSPYTTALVVTCASTSPCAGQTQSISLTLNVSAPPAQLSVSTTLLAFTSTTANPVSSSLPLTVQNSGGGNLAISSITPADGWVSVSGTPSSIASGPGVPVTVSVNPAGLPVGYNSSSVTVTSAAGSITVPVTLVISQNTSMSLSPTTQQFSLAAGGTVTPNSGSFQVSVNGTQPITWSASLIPGANWLALNSTSGTSSSGSAGVANYTLNNSAISALTPGTYFGTIQVTAAGVNNSPQNYQVQLLVGPSTALPVPNPNPSGFVLQTGVALTQAVSVGVASASNPTTSVPYQASASTTDGANWLTVTPAAGNTSASSPAASTVTASAAGLAPGVYYGLISYAFSTAAVRSVNITFFVTGPASSVVFGESPRATSTCTPKQLIPTQIGLVSNFSQLATLSVPLKILLTDNCGNPVPSGQVTTTFSNGDSSITLTPVDSVSGIFTGTWTPLGISNQVNVTATATGGGLTAGSSRINGAVTAYAGPVLSQNAVLNVYNPLIGGAIAPGDILQIYGSNLAATVATSSKLPLTTTLGSTSVSIGGTPVPLYYVSPTQINAQAPFELTAGNQYQVVVNVNGALTAPATISVSPAQPGIAGYQNGQIIAQHLDGTLVSEASPAVAGTYVVFYLAGLGPTDTPVADGAASPVTPLAHPVNMPTLTLNGVSQPYQFVGLTPGLVGLYQINFLVPSTLAGSGDSTLVISQSGSPSNTVILPIQ